METNSKIIYVEMVADLLHYGHLNYLKNIYEKLIKNTTNKLYLGIHNDNEIQIYKRRPVLNMNERIKILSFVPFVDKIIPNAPVSVTQDYINLHKIDKICMPNNRTEEEIKLMYEIPYKNNMMVIFDYTTTISTSEIINRIQNRDDL